MPIYRIDVDSAGYVGKEVPAIAGLPCFVSAADPAHGVALIRSNISINAGGAPLIAEETERKEGWIVDWRTMLAVEPSAPDEVISQQAAIGDTNEHVEQIR